MAGITTLRVTLHITTLHVSAVKTLQHEEHHDLSSSLSAPCLKRLVVVCLPTAIHVYTKMKNNIIYCILICIDMTVVLNSFMWKQASSPKKLFSPNFSEPHVYL